MEDHRDAMLARHLNRFSCAVESVDWNAKMLHCDVSVIPSSVLQGHLALRLTGRQPASSEVMTMREPQSSMRLAIDSGEKPAKFTEWMAPMRLQASIALNSSYRAVGPQSYLS